MKKKFLIFLSLILVLSVLLVGCTPPAGEDQADTEDKTEEAAPSTEGEKILRTNNSSEPGSLDPPLAQGTHESWVLDHAFEGLMKIDKDLNVEIGRASCRERV